MPAKLKRKSIAVGDWVWMLRNDYGPAVVTKGVVKFIGKSDGKRIYNCTDISSERKNVILDKDEVRPFTDQGKAELLRVLVGRLQGRSIHYRRIADSIADRIGTLLIEVADLEKRGKKR